MEETVCRVYMHVYLHMHILSICIGPLKLNLQNILDTLHAAGFAAAHWA